MKLRGIDISAWQGDFNLAQAKVEGFEFVIAKAGEGVGSRDGCFESTYRKAKRLGMPVGAFWYSRATSVEAAIREADAFADALCGKQLELPVYMDIECEAQMALSRRALTDVVKAFCHRMEQRGFWAGIYSGLFWFRDQMIDEKLQDYAHWVAQWSTSCDYQSGEPLGMWQYGGETNYIRPPMVAGQVVDQDYMLTDYPALIRAAGCNGFPAPEPHPAEFSDVPADAYYAEAVRWAVHHGITAGIDPGRFGPEQPCTRAEALTMIWAMQGKPDPEGSYNPFHDVGTDDYFQKAVVWALEQSITAGVGPREFGPNQICTRAQIVTMLYSLVGSPHQEPPEFEAVGFGGPGDYFFQAMLWANRNGVIAGVGGGDMAPRENCTRAMIVQMVYRYAQL